jgi:hypothetical protein
VSRNGEGVAGVSVSCFDFALFVEKVMLFKPAIALSVLRVSFKEIGI